MSLLARRPAPAAFQDLAPKGRLSPIIKWVGGKSRLLPELVARAPKKFRRYYEPFVGGAALFLHLEPENATLADTNEDLINVYQRLAKTPGALIWDLERLTAAHDEEHYYETRAQWNDPMIRRGGIWHAAAFIYLNKTCFNGLWRVNSHGEFNVPMGDYENPTVYDEFALRAASLAFSRATIRVADFRQAIASAQPGDFIYFDPPYIPVSPTASFTAYTPDGFGEVQQLQLAAEFRRLAGRGVQVMASNSDTPMTRELYAGFQIDSVSRAGTVNSDATKRGRVGELIITAGYC